MQKIYTVNGMSCVICKNNVQSCLSSLNGISSAKVNLLENEVTIEYDENIVNEELMAKAIKDIGYELVIHNNNSINKTKLKLIISIILVIVLMYFSMGHMINLPTINNHKYIQLILCVIIIIINRHYFVSGYKSLIRFKPNMDSLVSLSSSVSFIYSCIALFNQNYNLYFETSAMILVIVSIGKYIEGINKSKTTKTIRGLATLIPMQANLYQDGKTSIIKIDELKKDDIVKVFPGESIPQDGVVLQGTSSVDESMITGESLPQLKTINSNVIGGTVNINGELLVQITSKSTNTTLSKIISLTKQATMNKIPIERFADTISKYFVYGVISISIVTFITWYIITRNIELSLNFALSVLVISCPCALGLATPSAIMVASGLCAKNGILIKNSAVLEISYKIKYLLLDKTGTLTKNKLEIVGYKQYDPEFIEVISSLEASSNHPIAKAIKEKFNDATIGFDKLSQESSLGVIGYIGNDVYYAGNEKLVSKYSSLPSDDIDVAINNNYSYIIVGKNKTLLGIIYLADSLKDTSLIAINNFKLRNIVPIMCTGDNELTAKRISNILNIDDYRYSLTPQDKNSIISEYKQKGIVSMVGDGINDAIALSSADVSFSMANGSDIAYASSDVVLMSNSINDINFLLDVSKKTMSVIKLNLFWALFYNALFIPLASGVFYSSHGIMLNPMIGAITMCISSIFVISNSLTINKIKKEKINFMDKTVVIEGMMCGNCARHATEALQAIGADVNVVLEENRAYIKNTSLSDDQIKQAIEKAGYEVVEIING